MNGINRSHPTFKVSGKLVIATLIALTCSIPVQAAGTSLKLLGTNELDQISAGSASSTVHTYAGGLGLHTYAGTGANSSVYSSNYGYMSVDIASGSGGAIAGGATSVATVDINASVSGNVTSGGEFSHSTHIPQTGASYAVGYTLLVSYTSN